MKTVLIVYVVVRLLAALTGSNRIDRGMSRQLWESRQRDYRELARRRQAERQERRQLLVRSLGL